MDGVVYEAIFDGNTEGVFGISLVENPATKETFIQLSEDEKLIQFATVDEEQRLLVGLALQPNAPVYRNQDGEEFHIVFKEDTIKNLAHNFFIGDHHKTSTIEHDPNAKIAGVTFVESWIVADSKRDKSNVFGLEYPEGSWMVTMKVDSDEVWNDYVKTGKVKGFSIDGMVKLKRIDNKSKITMSALKEKLTAAANAVAIALGIAPEPQPEPQPEPTPVQMGEVMLMGGEVVFEFEGETLEAGVNVFAVDKAEPENRIPVPVGNYELEDGSIMVITEEGVVGEIKPKEEPQAEPEPTPEPQPEPVAATDEGVQKIQSILIKYQEDMDARMKKLEDTVSGMSESIVAMSAEPIKKPRTSQASTSLTKTGRLLKTIRNN